MVFHLRGRPSGFICRQWAITQRRTFQYRNQAISGAGPSGIKIFNPGIFGTGFYQIPESRDFSGRDLPLFLIPGFFRNFSGIFRDFCFCFVCGSNHIIFTNLHHYHCHHHNRPHHHWPRPPFSFIALRKNRQNNCNKGFVCKQYFYQMQ